MVLATVFTDWATLKMSDDDDDWLCFSSFLCFLCICVLVLYLLVVTAASIDGCLCLSGSLPLLSCMLVLIVF